MNGIKFLLDTNIIIGLVKGNESVLKLLQHHDAKLQTSGYSFITRIELLGYPTLGDREVQNITTLLDMMQYLPMTLAIEEMTIQIRRQYGLKIPDAIIAATAKIHCLSLITLDKQLASRMTDVLG